LLGHHAGDQAETVLMRALGGSGPAGLAAMPAIRETAHLRLVRPLLSIAPGRLRACLRAQGIGWAEDPTNRDPTVLRVALRHHLADAQGDGPAIAARLAQSRHFAAARASADARIAEQLARNIRFMPEGYAVIAPGRLDVACLAAIITCLSGAAYAPRRASLDHLQAALAANGAATLGGIRFMPAGRLGPGHLALREAAAVQPPVPAVDGAIWNGVFRLDVAAPLPEGSTLGALGDALSGPRDRDRLPAALRRALPALRVPGAPAAPLHRDHFLGWTGATVRLTLLPRHPASGAIFAGQQAG
jgi:tRNA(Ile)-lysidine synthase